MREEYLRTGDNTTAVADGIATTARVITAAAAIMTTGFASFLFNPSAILKRFGLALATAILMDATIVRDRKSTSRTPVTNAPLVCRTLLETKMITIKINNQHD